LFLFLLQELQKIGPPASRFVDICHKLAAIGRKDTASSFGIDQLFNIFSFQINYLSEIPKKR
jgi:hypothetical protein